MLLIQNFTRTWNTDNLSWKLYLTMIFGAFWIVCLPSSGIKHKMWSMLAFLNLYLTKSCGASGLLAYLNWIWQRPVKQVDCLLTLTVPDKNLSSKWIASLLKLNLTKICRPSGLMAYLNWIWQRSVEQVDCWLTLTESDNLLWCIWIAGLLRLYLTKTHGTSGLLASLNCIWQRSMKQVDCSVT